MKKINLEDLFKNKDCEKTIELDECYQTVAKYGEGGWGKYKSTFNVNDVAEIQFSNSYDTRVFLVNVKGKLQLWRKFR